MGARWSARAPWYSRVAGWEGVDVRPGTPGGRLATAVCHPSGIMTPIIPVRSAGLLSAAVRDRVRLTGTSSVLIGVAAAVLAWLAVVILATRTGLPWVTGQDAIAYWSMSIADPYARAEWTTPGAFVYSPAFAQLIAPLAALPWLTFIALWTALQLLAVRHLAGPRLLAIGVVVAAAEIAGGNISLFLAVAIVVGFRWPAAWAFVVLTKVTPAVALLWFAVRGEWRSFAIATGATALVVAVSAVIAPGAWVEWLDVWGARRARCDLGGRAGAARRAPAAGHRPRGLGRPDRSTLGRAGRCDARPAGALVRRS